jgi:hypothetical protein
LLAPSWQTSNVLSTYSQRHQEKKSHSEDRHVIEILHAFLEKMLQEKPTDEGAPVEYWHPGELVPDRYPIEGLEGLSRPIIEARFPLSHKDDLNDDASWKDHVHQLEEKHLGFLSERYNPGYNARWICEYRKKILAAFLEEDTKYMLEILHPLATNMHKKPGINDIMMGAFHTRSKNRVYHLKEGIDIEMQPKTLTAFILLISDFVFSKGTMITMDCLLSRYFKPHPALQDYFMTSRPKKTLPGLNMDYKPLHDHPNAGWMENDRLFIEQAFLHPQSILVDGFIELLSNTKGNSTYVQKFYRDRLSFMVSAQWLNIVNLVGYQVQPTHYMEECFPGMVKQLTSYDQEKVTVSNLSALARGLSRFLFGKDSIFKLEESEDRLMHKYCLKANKDLHVNGNWVKDPWIYMELKDTDVSDSHPLYSVANQRFTLANIVELLFFGKMWDVDAGKNPVDAYKKKPFYHDEGDTWAPDFILPEDHFMAFDEEESEEPADAVLTDVVPTVGGGKKDHDEDYTPGDEVEKDTKEKGKNKRKQSATGSAQHT